MHPQTSSDSGPLDEAKDATVAENSVKAGRFVYEYAGGPHGRRYEVLREEVCRNFCRLDIEPSGIDHLDCKVEIVQLGSFSLGTAYGSSGRFMRTRSLMSDGCDDFVLITAMAGKLVAKQDDTVAELRQGEMCLLEMNANGAVGLEEGNHLSAIRLPRRELLSLCPTAEDMLAKPLGQEPGIRTLIQRYHALSAATVDSLDAEAQQVTARHMADLIALLLRAGDDDHRMALHGGAATARLQLIQSQVTSGLHDTGLSITSIAERNNLSPKQVQRLFERTGMTFAEFVLEQRLLYAHRLLGNPGGREQKIAMIAYAAGFGDLSYFNRAFRRRFGMTPSDRRDGQLS